MEAIIAVNNKNIIGVNNKIPWNVPEDLQYFRKKTQNHVIVMGRKTFESFRKGPLPNRINIVITRKPENYKHLEQQHEGLFFRDINEVKETTEKLVRGLTEKKIFVIGGTQIYEYFFPNYTKIHITKISSEEDGDTHNPFTEERLEENNYKIVIENEVMTSRNKILFQHITYEKC
jgi:dihydrofolate reductase